MEGAASLYLSRAPLFFGGEDVEPDKAEAILIGIPYDYTSSYRPGSRFAPKVIREAAANIEFYSLRANIDLDAENIFISDLGDIIISSKPREALRRIRLVVSDIARRWPDKLLVVLGGEHTITLGVLEGLMDASSTPCILVFDAHFDLRNEYMGEKYSHASVMRRVYEIVGGRMMFVGVRAFTKDELSFALHGGLSYITSRDVRSLGVGEVARRIANWLRSRGCREVYLSIDVDVLDPAFAPGVGNPEPEGLEPWLLLDIIFKALTLQRVVVRGTDIVEVSPPVDCNGITSVTAAKIVVEMVALHRVLREFETRQL